MLNALDNFFCKLEGKTNTQQPKKETLVKIRENSQLSRKRKTINSLGSADLSETNRIFNEKLKVFEENGFALPRRDDYFDCGFPGDRLKAAGFPTHPVIMTQSVLRKAIGLKEGKMDDAHNFVVSDFVDFPLGVQAPVLIITGETSNTRLLFTNITSPNQRKGFAAVHFQKTNGRLVVNDIASFYGKPNSALGLLIKEAIAKNTVWDFDDKKIKDWLSEIGQLQLLPKMKTSPLGATKLMTIPANSKFNQKNLLATIPQASKCKTSMDCIEAIHECCNAMVLLELLCKSHDSINGRLFSLVLKHEYVNAKNNPGVSTDWENELNQYRNGEGLGRIDKDLAFELAHIALSDYKEYPKKSKKQGTKRESNQPEPSTETETLHDEAESKETAQNFAKLQDFGLKIGNARKDLATKGFSNGKKGNSEELSWHKKYKIFEVEGGFSAVMVNGQFIVKRIGKAKTEAEAEQMITMFELSLRHRVYKGKNGKYAIYRFFRSHKSFVIKDGFETENDAMRYMCENALDIIKWKAPEIERPYLDKPQRTTPDYRNGKNITPELFQKTFAIRGVEFGNWLAADERQRMLNMCFDAFMDIANTLGIEPKDVSLGGELSIGFGSRGQGFSKAAAHYERKRAVINLTKYKGAGALAHEWGHAFDHYISRLGGNDNTRKGDTFEKPTYASDNTLLRKLSDNASKAVANVIDKMLRVEKEMEVNHAHISENIKKAQTAITRSMNEARQYLSTPRTYGLKKKPATAAQLEKFDAIAKRINDGNLGERKYTLNKGSKFNGSYMYEVENSLSELFKEVTGRGNVERYFRPYDIAVLTRWTDEAKKHSGTTSKMVKTSSQYRQCSLDMDKSRAGAYWSKNCELFARAFEAFIEDEIAATGAKNEYLVHDANNAFYIMMHDARPYPEGDERKAINAAIINMVAEIFATSKRSPDSPPTEPGKPRKSGVRTKVAKHNKAKGTKTTKIRIPKGATAQLEDETFVPYNYHEMQDELEQLGYKAIVPANDRNVSVTGKGKRLFKGNMRSALAVKNELNAMGYAVRLHKDADGIYDILVIGKLKKPDYESPTEALQRVTKELKKPSTPLRHAKQERLTNPIDIYIFKAGNLFRGIPTEQIKTLLIAFERLKKDKKGWAKYSETGDLWDLDLSAHEMDILGLDKDWNKEPESILFTLKSRFSYGLSELGEKIVNNYFAFKSVKANLKPFNIGQLRLFGLQGINEINDQFNNELNALITGKLPKNHVFYLGDMSDVLTIIGIKALPVELQANRLQRKTEQVNHVFEFQNLIDLPAKLNAPIMVFKSKTVVGSIVVLTEIIKDNHNFVVAIEIGRTITKWKKGEIQINDVRSIYPKDTFTDVLNWIEKDKLLQWVDKKKALELLVRWRSDYAKATQQIKSCTKIIQNFENGNTSLNGAKARKKEFWTEIKGEIQRVEKLENGMILWHDFTKGECRGIRSQTELFKTKKEAINYFKVGKKNTLGEIDIIPKVPRMPQMPTIETEITPVAPVQVPIMPQIPQMPTDNMADLGFISDFNALQKGETFRLPGALGEFLGEYDRHCYSIALRGEKGAGKSRLVYQLMNAFASQGLNVAFLTLEMSYNSSISIGYRDEYIQPENIARIKPTEKAMTFDELDKVCKQFDVVVIDSWTKLKGMNQTDFDRLQKLNPRTIIVAIFQSTTGGVSRGGNMPEYDAGTVIQVNKGGFAECEKNRYAPCDKIFSVFDKMLIAPEAMEAV